MWPHGKHSASKPGVAMIDALVSGRLRSAPSLRCTASGTPFATWRMAASDKKGDSVLCSCITFSATAIDAVLALADGDSIAVTGEVVISTWTATDGTARHGLDVLAHGVLSAYHAGRKRKAAQTTDDDSERGPL